MNRHTAVFNGALSASQALMGLCPLEVFNVALSASQALVGLCLLTYHVLIMRLCLHGKL